MNVQWCLKDLEVYIGMILQSFLHPKNNLFYLKEVLQASDIMQIIRKPEAGEEETYFLTFTSK